VIKVTERPDGTRRVSIDFDPNEVEITRKSNDRKLTYETYPSRSRTKPEFHKEANINRIMKKYRRTGLLGDPLQLRNMKYGDFATGNDFSDMYMRVKDAQFEFNSLPAKIRNRFNNDPAQLVDFINDPKNDAEAIELGLRAKPKITKARDGEFVVVYRDGVEIERRKASPAAATAEAPANFSHTCTQ